MALLVLCLLISAVCGYPHVENDEDQTAPDELLDGEEDDGLAHDEEEQEFLEEARGVENEEPTGKKTPCIKEGDKCEESSECCRDKNRQIMFCVKLDEDGENRCSEPTSPLL